MIMNEALLYKALAHAHLQNDNISNDGLGTRLVLPGTHTQGVK